jgi:hypothetical protein
VSSIVGDDDLDLLHVGHCRGMTTDLAHRPQQRSCPVRGKHRESEVEIG